MTDDELNPPQALMVIAAFLLLAGLIIMAIEVLDR